MFLPLIPLYTRLDRADIVGHSLRRDILAYAGESPGASLSALASHFGVDYKTVVYHTRVLERANLLVVLRAGRSSQCYLPGGTREAFL